MMIKLADNVLMMGNRHFNYFIVGKERAALIECGVTGGVASFKQDWQQLQQTPRIQRILAMHEHFDHVCGIPALREMFPQVPVLAHSRAGRVLQKAEVIKDFFQQDARMSVVLKNRGILDHIPMSPRVDAITIDEHMGEGYIIEIDQDTVLKIMETPGHSPGSIAAYLPREQVMFLSDTGGYQIRDDFIFPIFFQNYEMYVESIERMSTYPTRILALPHGEIWTGVSVDLFYRRALKAAQNAYKCIRRMLEDGVEDAEMENRLYERYYRDDLMIYTPENIGLCVKLLVQRVKECR